MLLLGDRDVRRAVEELIDRDPALGAGEWRAGTGVDAVPEGNVLARVPAVDVELVGIGEHPRIAVARARYEHQRAPGRDVHAGELGPDTRPCGTGSGVGSPSAVSPQ